MTTIYFFAPTYRPVGGVLKVFDYALHSLDHGLRPVICVPETYDVELPIFSIERYRPLMRQSGVRHVEGFEVGIEPPDLASSRGPSSTSRSLGVSTLPHPMRGSS